VVAWEAAIWLEDLAAVWVVEVWAAAWEAAVWVEIWEAAVWVVATEECSSHKKINKENARFYLAFLLLLSFL
jgi:hypothetical protein